MPRAKSTTHFRPDITGNRDSDFRSQNALFIPALINIEKQQSKKSHKPRPQKEQDNIRMLSVLNSKAREQRLKQLNIKNQQLQHISVVHAKKRNLMKQMDSYY